jgi:RimJ/RimL family protein N-acetyltransferase
MRRLTWQQDFSLHNAINTGEFKPGRCWLAFFMLRGFDDGFERPSFGVYIAEAFANRGLAKLALQYALVWCRLNHVAAVMLKVHPENHYARRVYEQAGFRFTEVCPRTGHDILEKRWS